MSDADGVAYHAEHLMDVFDAAGWGWLYWCWTPTFATSEAARCLATRPRPRALAADYAEWGRRGDWFVVTWQGREAEAPSELWVPRDRDVTVTRDGAPAAFERAGDLVRVPAGQGAFRLDVN